MLEAEGKLAAHLQIIMHDWPADAKQNTIDHVLAALKEQRINERNDVLKIVAETQDHVAQRGNWTAEDACERISELIQERR